MYKRGTRPRPSKQEEKKTKTENKNKKLKFNIDYQNLVYIEIIYCWNIGAMLKEKLED